MESNILLESGTGEVEILEFIINDRNYGINVIKVKEIIEIDNITKLPLMPPSIAGVTVSRGEVLTLINLKYVIDNEDIINENPKVIIAEFNQTKVAFIIDDVIGIHRLSWEDVRKPDSILSNNLVIGNILFDDKIILLLDFEKIVTDINPEVGITSSKMEEITSVDRSKVRLVLADDSAMIRQLVKDTLTKAGYENMIFFNDGKETLDYLTKLAIEEKEDFIKKVHILITDIEMPQMDGHTLTKKIKDHPILSTLPVVIFSSLITGDLKHKGVSVGADAQMSKPEIGKLVNIVDSLSKEHLGN